MPESQPGRMRQDDHEFETIVVYILNSKSGDYEVRFRVPNLGGNRDQIMRAHNPSTWEVEACSNTEVQGHPQQQAQGPSEPSPNQNSNVT